MCCVLGIFWVIGVEDFRVSVLRNFVLGGRKIRIYFDGYSDRRVFFYGSIGREGG